VAVQKSASLLPRVNHADFPTQSHTRIGELPVSRSLQKRSPQNDANFGIGTLGRVLLNAGGPDVRFRE